uniref:Uncharacterized protein n=1 Tax=Anguilla anguilla TaxID=7936 RepID=A0A0E9QMY7_ANGAN
MPTDPTAAPSALTANVAQSSLEFLLESGYVPGLHLRRAGHEGQ